MQTQANRRISNRPVFIQSERVPGLPTTRTLNGLGAASLLDSSNMFDTSGVGLPSAGAPSTPDYSSGSSGSAYSASLIDEGSYFNADFNNTYYEAANGINAGVNAGSIYAPQSSLTAAGGNGGTPANNIGDSILNFFGTLFGGTKNQAAAQQQAYAAALAAQQAKQQTNWTPFLIAGGGLLAVGAVALAMSGKRRA